MTTPHKAWEEEEREAWKNELERNPHTLETIPNYWIERMREAWEEGNLKGERRRIILQAQEEGRAAMLEEVTQALIKRFDTLEGTDPDKSTENWRNYKFIRNNIRQILQALRTKPE